MADIIGLAASIVQLGGAGAELSIKLYNFVNSATRADHDIIDLAEDLDSTGSALGHIGRTLKARNFQAHASQQAIHDAEKIKRRCEAVFAEVQEIIKKRKKLGKDGKETLTLAGKMTWPLKEQRVELLRRRLDSLKLSLSLLLDVLKLKQGESQGKLEAELERERETIRVLYQQRECALRRELDLEARFRKLHSEHEIVLQATSSASSIRSSEPSGFVAAAQSTQLHPQLNANIAAENVMRAHVSKLSDGDTTTTDDEGDTLTLEELSKCATHVEQLLQRITDLQRGLKTGQIVKHHRKRRMQKSYKRFCRRFESHFADAPGVPRPSSRSYSRGRSRTISHHEIVQDAENEVEEEVKSEVLNRHLNYSRQMNNVLSPYPSTNSDDSDNTASQRTPVQKLQPLISETVIPPLKVTPSAPSPIRKLRRPTGSIQRQQSTTSAPSQRVHRSPPPSATPSAHARKPLILQARSRSIQSRGVYNGVSSSGLTPPLLVSQSLRRPPASTVPIDHSRSMPPLARSSIPSPEYNASRARIIVEGSRSSRRLEYQGQAQRQIAPTRLSSHRSDKEYVSGPLHENNKYRGTIAACRGPRLDDYPRLTARPSSAVPIGTRPLSRSPSPKPQIGFLRGHRSSDQVRSQQPVTTVITEADRERRPRSRGRRPRSQDYGEIHSADFEKLSGSQATVELSDAESPHRTSDEDNGNSNIRLRADASISLTLSGDTEGRTLQIVPSENGMSDIVISSNARGVSAQHSEVDYYGERPSVGGQWEDVDPATKGIVEGSRTSWRVPLGEYGEGRKTRRMPRTGRRRDAEYFRGARYDKPPMRRDSDFGDKKESQTVPWVRVEPERLTGPDTNDIAVPLQRIAVEEDQPLYDDTGARTDKPKEEATSAAPEKDDVERNTLHLDSEELVGPMSFTSKTPSRPDGHLPEDDLPSSLKDLDQTSFSVMGNARETRFEVRASSFSSSSSLSQTLLPPVDNAASFPTKQITGNSREVPSRVRVRSLTRAEERCFNKFEIHARECTHCHDPLDVLRNHAQLCERGYPLAQDVISYIYLEEHKYFPTWKIVEDSVVVQVQIPPKYVEVIGLLRAVERSSRNRSRWAFVAPRDATKNIRMEESPAMPLPDDATFDFSLMPGPQPEPAKPATPKREQLEETANEKATSKKKDGAFHSDGKESNTLQSDRTCVIPLENGEVCLERELSSSVMGFDMLEPSNAQSLNPSEVRYKRASTLPIKDTLAAFYPGPGSLSPYVLTKKSMQQNSTASEAILCSEDRMDLLVRAESLRGALKIRDTPQNPPLQASKHAAFSLATRHKSWSKRRNSDEGQSEVTVGCSDSESESSAESLSRRKKRRLQRGQKGSNLGSTASISGIQEVSLFDKEWFDMASYTPSATNSVAGRDIVDVLLEQWTTTEPA